MYIIGERFVIRFILPISSKKSRLFLAFSSVWKSGLRRFWVLYYICRWLHWHSFYLYRFCSFASLYTELVPSIHMTANLLSYFLFNRYQMFTPAYRETKNRLADMNWKSCWQSLASYSDKGAINWIGWFPLWSRSLCKPVLIWIWMKLGNVIRRNFFVQNLWRVQYINMVYSKISLVTNPLVFR